MTCAASAGESDEPENTKRRADGSAGGQHACAIAQGLGIETVIVPRFSSILSAYGIACADLTAESAVPFAAEVTSQSIFGSSSTYKEVLARVDSMKADVTEELVEQGANADQIDFTVSIAVAYDGADTILQIPLSTNLLEEFKAAHLRETSFSMERKVNMSGVRVRGVGKSFSVSPKDYASGLVQAESAGQAIVGRSSSETTAYFEVDGSIQTVSTPVYVLGQVPLGSKIAGPAIIVDSTQTIVVEPGTTAFCLAEHVILRVPQSLPLTDTIVPQPNGDSTLASLKNAASSLLETVKPVKSDPIMLAVFANRFMSIAEQMGHTLQRTSISVSIKERLDFSCSIHGTDGALVANAPHIPVHLGSMQYAVQAQHEHWKGKLRPGDVLLTNHPQWGGEPGPWRCIAEHELMAGTHLPDLTVVTPVFDPKDDEKILFYVASRGHHTDMYVASRLRTHLMPLRPLTGQRRNRRHIHEPHLKAPLGRRRVHNDLQARLRRSVRRSGRARAVRQTGPVSRLERDQTYRPQHHGPPSGH